MTQITTLSELAGIVHETSVEHGWWGDLSDYTYDGPQHRGRPTRNFGEIIALIHSEASEALEEYRKGVGITNVYCDADKPQGIPIEFADIIIRVLDVCAAYGIDIDEAMRIKMEYNDTRPYKHGGKVC